MAAGLCARMEVPPGGGGSERSERGGVGDGTKRGSRAGDCPAREPWNLHHPRKA